MAPYANVVPVYIPTTLVIMYLENICFFLLLFLCKFDLN